MTPVRYLLFAHVGHHGASTVSSDFHVVMSGWLMAKKCNGVPARTDAIDAMGRRAPATFGLTSTEFGRRGSQRCTKCLILHNNVMRCGPSSATESRTSSTQLYSRRRARARAVRGLEARRPVGDAHARAGVPSRARSPARCAAWPISNAASSPRPSPTRRSSFTRTSSATQSSPTSGSTYSADAIGAGAEMRRIRAAAA